MTTKHIMTVAVDDGCDIPTDRLAEVVHQLVPGSHTLNNTEVVADLTDFEWDELDEHPTLPIGEDAARTLMDADGNVTVVTLVDQKKFMHAWSVGYFDIGTDDEHDLLHDRVFSFGSPYSPTTKILAVTDNDFVVSYTTVIAGCL